MCSRLVRRLGVSEIRLGQLTTVFHATTSDLAQDPAVMKPVLRLLPRLVHESEDRIRRGSNPHCLDDVRQNGARRGQRAGTLAAEHD